MVVTIIWIVKHLATARAGIAVAVRPADGDVAWGWGRHRPLASVLCGLKRLGHWGRRVVRVGWRPSFNSFVTGVRFFLTFSVAWLTMANTVACTTASEAHHGRAGSVRRTEPPSYQSQKGPRQ
jgi:hypothetical protein